MGILVSSLVMCVCAFTLGYSVCRWQLLGRATEMLKEANELLHPGATEEELDRAFLLTKCAGVIGGVTGMKGEQL